MAVNFMSSNKIDITSRFVNIYKESECSHNCYLMSVQWRPEEYCSHCTAAIADGGFLKSTYLVIDHAHLCLWVCNQGAYADNLTDAVNRRLFFLLHCAT